MNCPTEIQVRSNKNQEANTLRETRENMVAVALENKKDTCNDTDKNYENDNIKSNKNKVYETSKTKVIEYFKNNFHLPSFVEIDKLNSWIQDMGTG